MEEVADEEGVEDAIASVVPGPLLPGSSAARQAQEQAVKRGDSCAGRACGVRRLGGG